MNQKSLTKLEFPKIIEMLTDHASSPGGASFCRRIKPMTDLNKIITAQEQTAAAFTRIVKKGIPSFSGCYAVSDSLKRLEIGSALSAPELLRIGKLLQTTARIKSYGRHENADDLADCLDVYFEQLAPLTPLSAEIDRCILGEDEISDDASSKLKQIRRSINGMNDKIHSTMTGLLNGSMRTYLQDAIITMRGDRYCLPVKAEYRSQVNGLIHDQSATGSTLFIEPMAVVKLNNDIRELEIEEAKEIEVILSTLSAQADLHRDEIRYDLENMVELDFIFARAALAMEQNANEPIFNTEGKIHLRKARHPLINAKKVVVEEIAGKFNDSQSAVVVEYRGLSVAEVTELRKSLREEDVEFKVYKNKLVQRATESAGYAEINDKLVGPNAIAFGHSDAVAPARILANFAKDHEALVIKAGIVEGKVLEVEEINEIAKLPGREGMYSMLLGMLQAPVSKFARVVKAVADAREENGGEAPVEAPAEEKVEEAAE